MAYVEGVVDVSILVPACFDNPLKPLAVGFLADILAQRTRAIVPLPSVLGAYHIATRYVRAPRVAVKKTLDGILGTRSPALYPHVTPDQAEDALDYAATYQLESWDGYLIALARSVGAKIVYSLDEELSKVREVSVSNPFPREKLHEYHEYVRAKLEGHPSG